jgi:hypothetical protein
VPVKRITMVRSEEIEKASPEIKELELSGETALLVHCARLHLSGPRIQVMRDILAAGVDWDHLQKRAIWHRLMPLLSHHLMSPELIGFVPDTIALRLQSIHYQSLARNMLLQDELGRILSAFNKEGIPVVILKGSALLDTVYPDISLRPMSDLDILVHPEDLRRAEALVLGLEYIYLTKQADAFADREYHHLPNLGHRKKGIFLEVHRHIVDAGDAFYFDISGFWARARPVRKANAEALAFSPEDLLIHLSVKFLLDRRYLSSAAVGQLCDISEISKHYSDSLDWDLVVKISRENGFAAGLYSVLYACQRILGTPVPAAVLHGIRPPQFDPAVADLFLRRRVLDTRRWLAHDLVDHQERYTRRRAFVAILGRSCRLAAEVFGGNGRSRGRGIFKTIRIKEIIPRLFRLVLKPSELKEDLLLDRWLHDLYRKT